MGKKKLSIPIYSDLDPNIDRVDLFNNFYLKSTTTLNGPVPSIIEKSGNSHF